MKGFFQGFFSLGVPASIAACTLAAATLMSCGGQTSVPPPNTDSGQNGSGGGGGGAPSLAMAGAYQATVTYTGNPYSSDFVSFLTPRGEWYGLYFLTTSNASVYPDIYTGTVHAASATSATVSPLNASQFRGLTVGSATISGSTSLAYQIDLSGVSLANSEPASFSPRYIPTVTGIGGDWLGDLKDSQSVADTTHLTFGFSDSGTLQRGGTYGDCTLALQLSPQTTTISPYYTATLQISGDTTKCGRVKRNGRAGVSMKGIAFIHASPLAGRTKRLEIILTDSTGSGISFRGDQ